MASDAGKKSWLIWVLFIVAGIIAALAFMKESPKSADTFPQDVLTQKSPAVQGPVGTIKAAHSTEEAIAIGAHKVQPAVVMPLQKVVSRDAFAIQVYSFKEKPRADLALEKLKAKGYKAYIMVSDLGAPGIFYRVRVGTFNSEAEAQKILEAITADFKSGIVVAE